MTPERKDSLRQALDRIESGPERIIVRQGNRNVALSELPTIEALQYVCKWLRRFAEEG